MNSYELPNEGLSTYLPEIEAAAKDWGECDIVNRMWHNDFTVWKDSPAEITNRLGWLSITDQMREQLSSLQEYSLEIKGAGFKHVVLLGMGGSSLGPEVLKQTFPNALGYPELIVLDSTVPSQIGNVTKKIDPGHTLFIVSSKSGSTIEPLCLEIYFRDIVAQTVGKELVHNHFITITDPGTQLAKRYESGEFRKAFLNSPTIGGRFSVLSFFGLVPAALIGLDVSMLLDRADHMRGLCSLLSYNHENPGVWLGITMGTMAQLGRDKLTVITSPSISSFGLWVEQLIAESTGKDGVGIIPIAGEPIVDTACYRGDRFFVVLRLDEDNNTALDEFIAYLKDDQQPFVVLELKDKYDLGAEFFRWEFATAVAGAVLGIHPFDQPNVQQAKDATNMVLQQYEETGKAPHIETKGSLHDLLAGAKENDYLAIMAYIDEHPLANKLIENFRKIVVEQYCLPTTFGYGPRYLHSTGQLHKGGPNTGLFLQITSTHDNDIPIPGKSYTFGVLADAQAHGDLQALQSAGRRTISIRLDETDKLGISKLIGELIKHEEIE